MSLYDDVREVTDAKFIYSENFARIISLALSGEKNAIVYGPAGHAKSMMTTEIMKGLNLDQNVFVQFFGEGMDESRLFGGLDFKKLEEDKILEYQPERSFLNSEIAVFEELFDAPASVLLALKDTLTAGAMRNGAQVFPMKTKTIICLTNKRPSDISDLGPAAHALIERFPLQLELDWPHYTKNDYSALMAKVGESDPPMNGAADILADICARCTEDGNFVSPRTAIHAVEICSTAAKMRGAGEVSIDDLEDLKFIPGMIGMTDGIAERVARAKIVSDASQELRKQELKIRKIKENISVSSVAEACLKDCKKLQRIQTKLANFACPDEHVKWRNAIRADIDEGINVGRDRAMALA